MAHWPEAQTNRYLNRDLAQLTPKSVTDESAIRQRLTDTRERGYVWVYEEFVEGINSVAAPVLEPAGRITAAIHVHGPAYRFPEIGEEDRIGRAVADAAQRLSDALAL
jgi:DNA-binding IclR family transcriptional regulator